MGFSNIVGHKHQLDWLRGALLGGRLHHAYLFVGPDGVGKRTIAMGLARALHCARANGDFCGSCDACIGIQNGNHPDVRIVGLLEKKKEIVIDQVRQLEKELVFRSFSGKPKVALIDPATLLNAPAQNALLKTLEEPPEQSILMLIASSG
ncbi:MAG TPA: DNA polymerase III subunit delta', partial [Candidatus Eisenbacteria bacterium]|nr:DNA polymerase III subunit delta' [Candidatus Eisenbacteria bacterium]